MSDLNTLFPNRPLQVLRSGKGRFWPLISALVAAGLAVGLALWQAPPLWHDFQISRDYRVIPTGEILGGACKTRQAIFTDCDVEFAYPEAGTRRVAEVQFMFLTLGSEGDYLVDVVQARKAPELVTISLAVEKIWSRIAMAAVFMALILAGLWLALRTFFQGRAAARAMKAPVRLTPLAATVTNRAAGSFLGAGLAFSWVTPEGKKRNMGGWLKRKEEPLILNDGTVLVALPEGGTVPILLDAGLKRVDFTEAERAEIFRKLDLAPA